MCNFLADRLVDLILSHDVVPAVNQMETHPFCQQKTLRELEAGYGVTPMAWAPFAEGQRGIFSDETLASIGAAHGKTAAQVILRWLRQEHIVAIPKSVNADRIAQNADVDDFELSDAEMAKIESMDTGRDLILDIATADEAVRLHGITFEQ